MTADRGRARVLVGQRHLRGRLAEDAAARYLEELGYTVLARNVRVGRLEIDLIARDGSAVVVVEVRTRRAAGSWRGGLGSVTAGKRRRVRCAGEALWTSRFSRDPTLQTMRFDVIAVHLEAGAPPRCEHVRAAF